MDVVIVGAGGHGRVALDALRAEGRHACVGFIDADASRAGSTVTGLPVLGPVNLLPRLQRQGAAAGAFIAIGDNRVRRSYADLVLQAGLSLITIVHPSAVVSPSARVGLNVLLAAGSIVGVEAVVGDSAIVNTGAIVDHECELGVACHIGPGTVLAGRVRVGEQALVGAGARVIPCMTIGPRATVGAGAVVIADVPADSTVVGVPARPLPGGSGRAD